MTNQVYANNMEVSCKAASGKSICATPDTCMTPPPPPGVPVPYPNTGLASDCTDGSSTVQISGQEVMLKDKSYFKRSSGDEAGCAPKKGIMSGQIMGKCYFAAWSMDVFIEGENVVRHLDVMTHNHASFVGNTAAWPYIDAAAMAKEGDCHADVEREKTACKDCKPHKKGGKNACDALESKTKPPNTGSAEIAAPIANRLANKSAADDCLAARKCLLQPYNRKTDEQGNKALGCCPPQTGHHLIEKASFFTKGVGGLQFGTFPPATGGPYESYNADMAPCVCAEGTSHNRGGTHELMHVFQKATNDACPKGTLPVVGAEDMEVPHVTTYGEAKESAAAAFQSVFPTSGCSSACIKKQLDAYHNQCGIQDDTRMKAVSEGINPTLTTQQAEQESAKRSLLVKAARAARQLTQEMD